MSTRGRIVLALCGVSYVDCAVLLVTPRILLSQSCVHIDAYVREVVVHACSCCYAGSFSDLAVGAIDAEVEGANFIWYLLLC